MQCIWQSLARIPSSGPGRVLNVFSSTRPPPAHLFYYSNTRVHPVFNSSTLRRLNTATSTLPSHPPPLSFLQSTPSLETSKWTSTLTRTPPSRLSLSATRAIHASLKGNALEDALFIVNSVRYACLPKSQQQHESWGVIRQSNIHFPSGVSPRLPTHALLHGLVRLGLSQQASQLATIVMNSGIRIRAKTLERIVEGLTKSTVIESPNNGARFKQHMESLLGTPNILTLKSSVTSDPNTAFALDLLHAAKKSRSHRTGAMFNMLLTLCLVNGEIIVASLIFGILAKEWEFRSQFLTRMTLSQPEAPEPAPSSTKLDVAYRYDLLAKTLRPTPVMLKAIMVPIHDRLARATTEDLDTPEFQEALQSLANLADLVDKRLIPFPQLTPIIQALSQCPKVENGVWVTGPEGPDFIPAYGFFHDILLRLMKSLPTRNPTQRSVVYYHARQLVSIRFKLLDPVHHMQFPLDSPSYNTLIHYALRNRFSPKLAKQIYEHMTAKRDPPLLAASSTCAFNIFLRSATLHRRRDIANDLLEVLQPHSAPEVWEKAIVPSAKPLQLPQKFKHVGRSELILPPAPPLEVILKENYTLSTYLTSLISCGQPRLVVQLMQELLPIVKFKHRYVPSAITDADIQEKWAESLVRAVAFGPHVLGTFLHAIVKYGATKKSHILFKLIIHAAKASHNPIFTDNPTPWNVTIPIYTMMLQAYKTEVKRFRRRTGICLLNYLLGKTTILYEMVRQDTRRNIFGVDKPDARFFNGLLKVFTEFLPFHRGSISEATMHLEQARQQHAKTGFTDDRGYLRLLEEVAEEMEALGFSIPVGFHHLFIGKRSSIFTRAGSSPEVTRFPFALSKPRSGSPYTLSINKRKSLPLVRRSRFRRNHNWRRTRLNG